MIRPPPIPTLFPYTTLFRSISSDDQFAVFGSGEEVALDINPGKLDRKSTRLNSSHLVISYAVFCLSNASPVNIDRKSTRLKSSHLVHSYAVFCLKKQTTIQTALCRHLYCNPTDDHCSTTPTT